LRAGARGSAPDAIARISVSSVSEVKMRVEIAIGLQSNGCGSPDQPRMVGSTTEFEYFCNAGREKLIRRAPGKSGLAPMLT
jgi:hypothetical protein